MTGVTAVLPLKQSQSGGSGSFLVRADDGERYWCKTLNNQQHPRVPINEQIVARLGLLIGAAVCEPQLVQIPSDLVGWEFRPGHFLEAGWAHGGREVEGCLEVIAPWPDATRSSDAQNAVTLLRESLDILDAIGWPRDETREEWEARMNTATGEATTC